MLTQRNYTNPCGSVVNIFLGEDVQIGVGARIGDRAQIGVGARIGEDAQIGKDARIGHHARIGVGARIGDRAQIGKDARIGDGAQIGKDARIGVGACLGDGALIGDCSQTLQPIYIARLGDGVAGWHITLTEETIQIGCQFHPLSDWIDFDDEQIGLMHCDAVEWWKTFKPIIVAMANARGWL